MAENIQVKDDVKPKQNKGIIAKLKTIKHLDKIVLIIAAVIVVFIFISTLGSNSGNTDSGSVTLGNYDNYAQELETKLNKVLSEIKGAGTVNSLVTLDGGPTIEIAYSTEERTNNSSGGTSGSSTDNKTIIKTPIIITKNGTSGPLVLAEYPPKIKGVIVVAQGADDIKVKLEILRATQAALKIENSCIEIFSGK